MSKADRTILIVDDDAGIVDALRDALEDEGYATAVAHDGHAALAYLRSHARPCLILLDWMMPGCDGATFRTLQLADASIAGIPVVLLTADLRLEAKREMLDAAAYLPKPVKLDELLAMTERYATRD